MSYGGDIPQVVETRAAPPLCGRGFGGNRGARRLLSDDDVRAMRWWAGTEGHGLRLEGQAIVLSARFDVSRSTVREILTRDARGEVVGPPLSTRRWTSPQQRYDGLLMWLVWFLLMVRYAPASAPLLFSSTVEQEGSI